jgi:N-acetylglucosamine-6-phosphate deacetylase
MRWLTHVRLPGLEGLWRLGLDDGQHISSVQALAAGSDAAGEDWGGDWLSPMGVDLQINGGLGLPFPELVEADLPRLQALLERLWRDGVEAICPTLVTCGVEPLREALRVLALARLDPHPPKPTGRCRLLGAHLEGPFLAPERRGAHPEQHLAAPSLDALNARLSGFMAGPGWSHDGNPLSADISLVTLAPELGGAEAVIQELRQRGVVVSLGHSAANEAQANDAFEAGVGMVTHAFNAMAGLHHRAPGPIAAATLRGDVALGLIADGVHVAPSMAVLLQRLAPDQVLLVSDALAPYGLDPGQHRWDERLLTVRDGSCRLGDGTLAGTTLPLLEGVRRLGRWSGDPARAIAAATVLPRRWLGDRRPLPQLLQDRSLAHCLRWPASDGALHWHHAEEE